MQRMLTPLCAALLLAPLAALAQGNAPITGRMANPPGFTPGEAYSVNAPAQATVQAASPARRAVTPTVTNTPANAPAYRSAGAVQNAQTVQTVPAGQPTQSAQAYEVASGTEPEANDIPRATQGNMGSQSATDINASSQSNYGNDYRPELSIWAPPTERVGDAALSALSMQASGDHAGGALPTLGVTAGPAFKRYVDTFAHPLPDWFQEKVEDKSN